jgi:hypothetical protein
MAAGSRYMHGMLLLPTLPCLAVVMLLPWRRLPEHLHTNMSLMGGPLVRPRLACSLASSIVSTQLERKACGCATIPSVTNCVQPAVRFSHRLHDGGLLLLTFLFFFFHPDHPTTTPPHHQRNGRRRRSSVAAPDRRSADEHKRACVAVGAHALLRPQGRCRGEELPAGPASRGVRYKKRVWAPPPPALVNRDPRCMHALCRI